MRTQPNRSRQRGAATLELGLLSLPLLLLTLGTSDFGRALHQYNTLAKTVRDAARYQATVSPGNTLTGRCLALTASPANDGSSCTGTALLPGLTLAQVAVCDRIACAATHNLQPTGRGVVNLVTVTITGYQFTSMAPFVMPSVTFGAVSATMPQPL